MATTLESTTSESTTSELTKSELIKSESSRLSNIGTYRYPKRTTLDYTKKLKIFEPTTIDGYKTVLAEYGGEIPFAKNQGPIIFQSIVSKYQKLYPTFFDSKIKYTKDSNMKSGEYSFGGGKKVDFLLRVVGENTVIILEFMNKSGKWDFTHTCQLSDRGNYFRREHHHQKVIVFAIAGSFAPDEILKIGDLNIEGKTSTPESIAEHGPAPTYIPFTLKLEGSKNDKTAPMAVPAMITDFKDDMARLNTGKKPKKSRKIKNSIPHIPNFDKLESAIPNEYEFKIKENKKTGSITLKKELNELIVTFQPKVSFTKIYISDWKIEKYPTIINDIHEIAKTAEGSKLNQNGCSLKNDHEKFNISIEMIIEKITKVFETQNADNELY